MIAWFENAPAWEGPSPRAVETRRLGLARLEELDQRWDSLERALRCGARGEAARLLEGLARKQRLALTPLRLEAVLAQRERTRRHVNRYRATLRLADGPQALALWQALLDQVPPPAPPTGGAYSGLGRLLLHYKLNTPRPDLPPEQDRDRLHLSFELHAEGLRDTYTLTWDWPDDRPVPCGIEVETDRTVGHEVLEAARRAALGAGFDPSGQARWTPRWQADPTRFLAPLGWEVALECRTADGTTWQARYSPDTGQVTGRSSRIRARSAGPS